MLYVIRLLPYRSVRTTTATPFALYDICLLQKGSLKPSEVSVDYQSLFDNISREVLSVGCSMTVIQKKKKKNLFISYRRSKLPFFLAQRDEVLVVLYVPAPIPGVRHSRGQG